MKVRICRIDPGDFVSYGTRSGQVLSVQGEIALVKWDNGEVIPVMKHRLKVTHNTHLLNDIKKLWKKLQDLV
jgi:hypothetical protein